MGINTHYYTVYGVKVEFNDELNEELHSENLYDIIHDSEQLDIIADGMGAEYMIIGKILFDSGDLRWGDIIDTFVEINIEHLPAMKELATEQFMNHFPSYGYMLDNEWKLMTLVHYS